MKKLKNGYALFALIFLTSAVSYVDDILEKLGTSKSDAEKAIIGNLTGQQLRLPYAKMLPAVMKGDKVAAAKELCAYIRQYCESKEFANAYTALRNSKKPGSEPPPMFDEETKKTFQETIKEYERNAKDKNQPAQMREYFQKQADEFKQQLAAANDPTPNKTQWEKEYPADLNQLVTTRLKEYLSLVSTVDFNAALNTNKYNKQVFVNPAYEKQSREWKACFRAGKEVNQTIKAFVESWLKEGVKTDS